MTSAPKQSIEYDGYYFVDAVAKNGHHLTISARGYNLKSWINFERSLGSQVEFRQVTEAEWMRTHWTQTPWTNDEPVETPKKPAKKIVAKKTPAKKAAVKKPVTKKAAKKAPAKKTTKAKNDRS